MFVPTMTTLSFVNDLLTNTKETRFQGKKKKKSLLTTIYFVTYCYWVGLEKKTQIYSVKSNVSS